MKCYNHPDVDALGICKNCNKGLCKGCLTEIENGIACTSTCIEEVKLINSLISRSKKSYGTASGAYSRNGWIYIGLGIVFIIFGLTTEGLAVFLSGTGSIFLIGGIFSFVSASKYKSEK